MSAGFVTVADLQRHLGGIPLDRIRVVPPLGLATDDDAMRIQDREGRTCEVIDGILIEKALGFFEARVATILLHLIEQYLKQHDLGIAVGPDGLIRLTSTRSRAPDVAFVRWGKFSDRKLPSAPVPHLIPDLAVEVLSRGNTRAEIETKLDEYFAAGVEAAWMIDPFRQTAKLYQARGDATEISRNDLLSAPSILPGFEVSLQMLFDRAGRRGG